MKPTSILNPDELTPIARALLLSFAFKIEIPTQRDLQDILTADRAIRDSSLLIKRITEEPGRAVATVDVEAFAAAEDWMVIPGTRHLLLTTATEDDGNAQWGLWALWGEGLGGAAIRYSVMLADGDARLYVSEVLASPDIGALLEFAGAEQERVTRQRHEDQLKTMASERVRLNEAIAQLAAPAKPAESRLSAVRSDPQL